MDQGTDELAEAKAELADAKSESIDAKTELAIAKKKLGTDTAKLEELLEELQAENPMNEAKAEQLSRTVIATQVRISAIEVNIQALR